MPKETLVKRGEEYLSGVQLSELEETYRREYPASLGTGYRLPCSESAIGCAEIVRILGRGISTVYR